VSTRELSVRITGDPKSLSRAFRQVDRDMAGLEKSSDRLRRGMGRLARGAALAGAAAGAGFAAGAVKATRAASDLEESVNKSRETFEAAGPAMEKWASTAATSLGMSKAAALENAASIGAMLKPMGVAPKRAAEMSREMVQLASDMASFNNEDPTEMLDRIRSGLSGESEPLKRFGAVLTETRVKQHAYKVGIAETGAELTEQQKIQARYSLLLKDTADQQGDFARTADGMANAQRIAKAQMADLSAQIGRVFLPLMVQTLRVVNDVAQWAQRNWPAFRDTTAAAFRDVRVVISDVVRWMDANVVPTVRTVVAGARRLWGEFGDEISAVARFVGRTIERMMITIRELVAFAMALLRGDWGRAWGAIKTIARTNLEGVLDFLRTIPQAAASIALTIGKRIAEGILNGLRGLGASLRDRVMDGISKIGGLAGRALDAVRRMGRAIVRGIVSGIKSIAGEIRDAVRDAILDAIPGRGGGGVGRAILDALGPIGAVLDRGGTVPGRRGQAVPIVAHAGEVVLNPSQQRIVGIDRIMGALRATGGIVGGDGAAFASGGWVHPAPGARLGGGPGQGTHSYTAPPNNWQSDAAYDLMGRDGMPVVAAGPGVIGAVRPFQSDPRFWGHAVYLSTKGIQLYYKHLKSVAVRPGQSVGAGEVLGYLGEGVNGGPHLHLGSTSLSALHSIVRAPAGKPGSKGGDDGHFTPSQERAPQLSPRERLAQTIRGAGISSGAKGIVNRVLQAGADVSAAVGARLGTSSARGERAVRAAGRAAARRARAAGKPPDQVAADEQAAERAKQGQLLRADIRRVNAALQRLAKRWAKLRADLKRVGKGGGDPAARRQALNRIRAAMRQNRRERDELIEIRAELIDELKELNEEIAQEQYEENFAGGDGEGPPTEADFAEAALAQAALTPGLEDDLSAARTIEDLARRDYEAALASGDPRRIADAARAYLSARQQRESIEEQIKAINENTEALKDLNRTFGGSVVFGYRGQDYVLRSLAPPSSDRLVGMEV
jgi:murein DD-endopeptidase MepM/ murein hydrolase activator NlpD